jgi:dephospho-CoA kinase
MLIGITGNFGTGKSTVLNIFKELGVITIDSDEIIKDLYKRKDIKEKVTLILGSDIIDDRGNVDKSKISYIIFNNNVLRDKLEALLHPIVFSEIETLSAQYPDGIVVAEIPLLFESGYNTRVDYVVLLSCSEETLLARLKKKGFAEDEIRSRLSSQIRDAKKRDRSDLVINTDKDLGVIKKDIEDLIEKLTK